MTISSCQTSMAMKGLMSFGNFNLVSCPLGISISIDPGTLRMDFFAEVDENDLQQAKDEGFLHGYELGYREGLELGYPEGYKLGRALGQMYHNLREVTDEQFVRKRDKLMADLLAFPQVNAEGIDRQQELHRLRAAYRELSVSCSLLKPIDNENNKFDF